MPVSDSGLPAKSAIPILRGVTSFQPSRPTFKDMDETQNPNSHFETSLSRQSATMGGGVPSLMYCRYNSHFTRSTMINSCGMHSSRFPNIALPHRPSQRCPNFSWNLSGGTLAIGGVSKSQYASWPWCLRESFPILATLARHSAAM